MRLLLPLCALAAAAAAAPFALRGGEGYSLLVVHNDCWAPYFVDLDWAFRPASLLAAGSPLRVCALDSAAKSIGVGITAGAVLVNVLQVRKVALAGNAEGMSLASQYSAALSNLLMSVWWVWDGTAPFSAWAECLFQAAGSLALVALMWRFSPPSLAHRAAAIAALAAVAALFGGKAAVLAATGLPAGALSLALYGASNASFWWARASQLYTTWAAGGDESQFIVTLVANAAGSLMRVFTSSQEVKAPPEVKPFIMYIMALNAGLNAALVAQWWYYGGKKGGGGGGGGVARARAAGAPASERPPSRSASVKATAAIAEQAMTPAKAAAARKRPQRA